MTLYSCYKQTTVNHHLRLRPIIARITSGNNKNTRRYYTMQTIWHYDDDEVTQWGRKMQDVKSVYADYHGDYAQDDDPADYYINIKAVRIA